ncbi:MAG TPA: SurA N-terminal domain-containing protein, partial [Candidatus Acidoferrum sp.]|nr:SurA N-terminal domain-containing protein [Candidatus Acidoferrum sp.]
MRKLLLFFALFSALPAMILAQDNSANTPQSKPADSQDKSTPALEKPGMAPATPETTPPPAPAKKAPPAAAKVDPNSGRVVEEIIARVNNEIITRSEYEKARATAAEDAKQDCQNRCTPEQLQNAVEDRQKNALRDLIDQSLLVQRGKDMGVSVEPEIIKKLDQIRIQNNLTSMEDLEKAVASQGLNWEDFKNNLRNGLLTQRVIGSEVGSHITIGHDEIEKYYNEHKSEFVRPEQVALRSIEVNTEKKSPEEIAELKKKAETTLKRIKDGDDFGEMAKRFSDGS